MNQVWVVTAGEYSGFHICGIFAPENEAMARELAEAAGGELAEWELDTWTREQGEWLFCFDFEGNITKEQYTPHEPGSEEQVPDEVYSVAWDEPEIKVTVQRGDHQEAIKIASERYCRIRAFLDEAIGRVHRAPCRRIYRYYNALKVAEILAGLRKVPNPPGSNADREILAALGIEETKPEVTD